ncbi:MAG: MarR family transcriptional regulator [Lachnospiraceae bacterium]|nr:MarR family transcriptional regulator [Lachnospiraceae bacterium]
MEFGKMEHVTPDISELSNEITYHKYLMNRLNGKRFFHDIAIPDYIVMEMAAKQAGESCEKLYLRDIARRMDIPVSRISQIARRLKDRGLVLWAHDGDGREGTYLILTETGSEALKRQEDVLKEYYEKVIARFGKEAFIQFLKQMAKLEIIMKEEAGKMKGERKERGGTANGE